MALAAYECFRRDIRSGSLLPGQPLRTEWLRNRYQTGVSPLREALARLSILSRLRESDDFDQLVDIRKDMEARALKKSIATAMTIGKRQSLPIITR